MFHLMLVKRNIKKVIVNKISGILVHSLLKRQSCFQILLIIHRSTLAPVYGCLCDKTTFDESRHSHIFVVHYNRYIVELHTRCMLVFFYLTGEDNQI